MEWQAYWTIFRRRWLILAAILVLDGVVSGGLFLRSYHKVGYQGCLTLYVADASAPSLISAPQSTLDQAGQLLAGETAANFFADDILDVAQSGDVASYISNRLRPLNLPNSSGAEIGGAVSGARKDRTLALCLANPSSTTALAGAAALGIAMTTQRAGFIGGIMAKRTFVRVISPASVAPAPTSHSLLNLLLRLFLGGLVALGAALLWDALDPTVRDRRDVEAALGVPVLATVS